MLRSGVVALTIFTALALTSVQAADTTFSALDKNADGELSLDEASANDQLFTAFENLDKNQDGKLSPQEFAQYKPG